VIIDQKEITAIQNAYLSIHLRRESVSVEGERSKVLFHTNRRGFPDVITPGSSRNDLFVTLEEGEFPENKTFEITTVIRTNTGDILPVSLSSVS